MRPLPLAAAALAFALAACGTNEHSASTPDASIATNAGPHDAMGDAVAEPTGDADANAGTSCLACAQPLAKGCTSADGGWICPRDYGELCAATGSGGHYSPCGHFIVSTVSSGTDCATDFVFDAVTQQLTALVNRCVFPVCTFGPTCLACVCDQGDCSMGGAAPCPAARDH